MHKIIYKILFGMKIQEGGGGGGGGGLCLVWKGKVIWDRRLNFKDYRKWNRVQGSI